MQSHQLYYLSFAGALLAGWSPGKSQRLAYHLSRLASTVSSDNPDEVDDEDTSTKPIIRPVNPLNHVDWKGGGGLNARWYQLCGQNLVYSQRRPSFVQRGRRHQLYDLLNQQVILTHTKQASLVDLSVILFAINVRCLSEHEFAWLLFHALRCVNFGMKFRWGEDYATLTESRQKQQSESRPYRQLVSALEQFDDADLMCQNLLLLIQMIPIDSQLDVLDLGIRYRPYLDEDDWQEDSASLRQAWAHLNSQLGLFS